MKHIQAFELDTIADCLNIEGGRPEKHMRAQCKGKFLWVNCSLDLDRPAVDGVNFTAVLNDPRGFPLLENVFDNLNEHHCLAAFLMIIQYYIVHAHQLLEKEDYNENVKITIHLHQDPSRYEWCEIIQKYLSTTERPKYIIIEYLTDKLPTYFTEENSDYRETDILISLSQDAGLTPKYMPGTLHIFNTFIPFDAKTNIIYKKDEYTVNNDLFVRLDNILQSKYNQLAVSYVNENFKSHNPCKVNDKAHIFTRSDFIESICLEVKGIWEPENKHQEILIL